MKPLRAAPMKLKRHHFHVQHSTGESFSNKSTKKRNDNFPESTARCVNCEHSVTPIIDYCDPTAAIL
jgi:hypothetical protein